MFKKSIIAAATIAATATSAFAMDAPSQGARMLAALSGVDAGVYSVNELVQLDDALSDDDLNSNSNVNYILNEGHSSVSSRDDFSASLVSTSAGADQLALNAGVAPGTYTVAELILIDGVDGGDERAYGEFIRDGGLRNDSAASVSISPAHQQLAGSLNVDAADFTLSQLVRLDAAVSDNSRFTVQTILNEAGVDTPVATVLN